MGSPVLGKGFKSQLYHFSLRAFSWWSFLLSKLQGLHVHNKGVGPGVFLVSLSFDSQHLCDLAPGVARQTACSFIAWGSCFGKPIAGSHSWHQEQGIREDAHGSLML